MLQAMLHFIFCQQEEPGLDIFNLVQQKRPLKCFEVLITPRAALWAERCNVENSDFVSEVSYSNTQTGA